jgi:hypothetical protein
MRTIGPADAPFLVPNAGQGAELRAGVSVSVTVLEKISPGLYRVVAGSKSLTASSASELSPGSVFRARVERAPQGPLLVLRLLPDSGGDEGLARLLGGTGLPLDAATRLAALALLNSGEAPSPESLTRVRRAALGREGLRGSAEERAEAAARLESKGLASSEEAVEALLGLADGSQSGEGEGQGTRHSDGQDARQNARQNADGFRPPAEALLPDPEIEPEGFARELGLFIKKLCSAADEGSAGILGLANHARSRGEDLLEIPFRFSLDRVAFAGSFRILLPYMPSGPGRFDARFVVSQEGEGGGQRIPSSSWAFSLRTGGVGGKKLLVLYPPPRGAEAERLLPAFRSELERLGCALRLGGRDGYEPSGKIDLDA